MVLSTTDTIKVLEEIQQVCRNAKDCIYCDFLGKDDACIFQCGADDWNLKEFRNV